jgi:hypothetical protein
METQFEVPLKDGMLQHAKQIGAPDQMNQWTADQTRKVCLTAAAYLRTTFKYNGEFEHLKDEFAAYLRSQEGQKPANTVPGVDIADLRKTIVAKLQEIIKKQTGQDATNEQCEAFFLDVAPMCMTQEDYVGHSPESLAGTTDPVWLKNIIAFIDDQFAHVAAIPPKPTEVPF